MGGQLMPRCPVLQLQTPWQTIQAADLLTELLRVKEQRARAKGAQQPA